MLTIRNFSKSYNGTLILAIKELEWGPGIHWIKGENGSGKSTLFKSISGLVPFEGDVVLKNLSLKKNPLDYRKRVNYAEAEPVYPGFLTAKDLVRFIGKTKGASIQQQTYFSDALGINSYFEKPCETYSSGMLKKLSLTLAFLGTPKIIILDEPLITLDERARNILSDLIMSALKSGIMFLISSHQTLENSSLTITTSHVIKNKTLIPE